MRLAHEIKNVFSVYVLQKQNRRQTWVMVRGPADDEPRGEGLADLHNVSGYDVAPPFLADHTSRIIHENPRWLKME